MMSSRSVWCSGDIGVSWLNLEFIGLLKKDDGRVLRWASKPAAERDLIQVRHYSCVSLCCTCVKCPSVLVFWYGKKRYSYTMRAYVGVSSGLTSFATRPSRVRHNYHVWRAFERFLHSKLGQAAVCIQARLLVVVFSYFRQEGIAVRISRATQLALSFPEDCCLMYGC